MSASSVQLPEVFAELWTPARYKAFYGGRGSAKSHSFAQALVIQAAQEPKRVLCCREIQRSIKDSVKRLLDDKIELAGLGGFYQSTETEIRGANGSLFVFGGLRTNTDSIKSLEGIEIAWVEEANTVSQASLDILVPTIRKPGSELWFSWNPRYETDPVDAMFRKGPPPGAIVRKVNWTENPWFPEVLKDEMEWDRSRDPDKYAHVWLGEYSRNSEARVFRNWRVEAFDSPKDAVFRFGADWGFAVDPTVLVRSFVVGRTLYVDQEAWSVECEIDNTPALFAGDCPEDKKLDGKPLWENPRKLPGIDGALKWTITADSARPETVSYMRRRGFKVTAAIKGQGSVEDGVEFLKAYDIVVHPRCRHVADELAMYSYKTDPLTGEILPVLEDKNNHTIDALRYALEALRRAAKPDEKTAERPKQDRYWPKAEDDGDNWKTN
jgi:phage terminase large subunit